MSLKQPGRYSLPSRRSGVDVSKASELLELKARELSAALDALETLAEPLGEAAFAMVEAIDRDGKILVAGNGGSAAEAQHFTGELVGRFMKERPGMPAISLHSDTSTLTAVGNDYGYERVFARQVEAFGDGGDVLMVLSTSGASQNLIEAVETAHHRDISTIGLLGKTRRQLHDSVDICLPVPSDYQPAVQEMHLFLVHALAGLIESEVFA